MKVEIRNYTKKIKEKMILDNINVSFESGKVYGLFGKNGSGKTMLFRAISTLILPSEGDVLVDGISILKNNFDLSKIGILIENTNYSSYLTGYENLELLYMINNKKNKEYLMNMLKRVGLEDAMDKKYKEYSLGMKQRLNIAQAFMENQQIILLDEPTNALDEKGKQLIYDFILEEKTNGKLIVIASHDKEDLHKVCDEIYKMEAGKISKIEKEVI